MDFDKISINEQDIYCKDSTARNNLVNEINKRSELINKNSSNDVNINSSESITINSKSLFLNSTDPIKYSKPTVNDGIESIKLVDTNNEPYILPTVNGVNHVIKKSAQNRTFLLFGDSLMDGYTPDDTIRHGWGYWCEKILSDKGYIAHIATDIRTTSYGSAFYGNKTYVMHLNATLTEHPEYKNEHITDIIVYTGTNDASNSPANTLSGIQSFVAEVKKYWPYCNIKIGYFGYKHSMETINALKECGKFGCSYIHGSEYLGLLNKYISSDNIHLSVEGYEYYSKYLVDGILSSCITYIWGSGDVEYSWTKMSSANSGNTAINYIITDNGVFASITNKGSSIGYGTVSTSGVNPGESTIESVIPFNIELISGCEFMAVPYYLSDSPDKTGTIKFYFLYGKIKAIFIGPVGNIKYGPFIGASYNKIM